MLRVRVLVDGGLAAAVRAGEVGDDGGAEEGCHADAKAEAEAQAERGRRARGGRRGRGIDDGDVAHGNG